MTDDESRWVPVAATPHRGADQCARDGCTAPATWEVVAAIDGAEDRTCACDDHVIYFYGYHPERTGCPRCRALVVA